jgi:hypothetical protein
MMVGARAAMAIKTGAGLLATFAVVGLGVAFWPNVKAQRVSGKQAVEQPVFVTSGITRSLAAPPPTVSATPVAMQTADKTKLDQLATALKSGPKPSATPAASAMPAMASSNPDARDCFARGLVALAKGDIAAARRWLEHSAEMGENRAYMALGDAYNPSILTRLGVLGARGDAVLARNYYNRAVAAGLSGAKDRLASVDSGAD